MMNRDQKSQSDEAATAKEEADETRAEVDSKATASDDHVKEEGGGPH
jgi:hypothetical protein